MTRLFDRRWVLVTGASSGLGVEMARRLADRGANLVLTARSRERLEELAADVARVNGVETRVIVADLGQPGGAAELVAATRRLNVPITHLVNNAGFGSAGAFAELDATRESQMVELNVGAVVHLTRALLGSMV